MGCWTDRETLLEINLQKQKIKRVKQLLSKGANPDNYSEDYKCSLLSIAISQRNEAMVRIMLKAGASTNQNIWHSQHDCKPSGYEYPLHIAVFQGSMGIIKALVEHGANVDIGQDSTIGTPLHQAAKQGHKEVTAYLLSKNADIIAIDRNLNTPLHTAALYGYEAVAKVLLLKRAPVNAKNSNLSTPLHCAASAGAFSVTKLLLEHGASVSLRDFANKTPLDLAKNESIRNLLKQHNLNHTQQESHVFGLPCTALHTIKENETLSIQQNNNKNNSNRQLKQATDTTENNLKTQTWKRIEQKDGESKSENVDTHQYWKVRRSKSMNQKRIIRRRPTQSTLSRTQSFLI